METIITLYKYDPRFCSCDEKVVLVRYDSERQIAPMDDTLTGRIKRAWKTWRGK